MKHVSLSVLDSLRDVFVGTDNTNYCNWNMRRHIDEIPLFSDPLDAEEVNNLFQTYEI